MAQSDAIKKYIDAGMAFTQLTRARAEAVVKELVAAGELQQKQTRAAIDELVERSRKNAETVADLVRNEVAQQLSGLGLATQADVARLEAAIAAVSTASPAAPAPTAPAAAMPKAPATKAAPAKAAPVKATVTKAGTTTKQAPAATKAVPATKAPAKKAAKKA